MTHSKVLAGLSGALVAAALTGGAAQGAVINSVSVFATAPSGATRPDSITAGAGSVWVAYAGGTDARTGGGHDHDPAIQPWRRGAGHLRHRRGRWTG